MTTCETADSLEAYKCQTEEQCDNCFMIDHLKECSGCNHYDHPKKYKKLPVVDQEQKWGDMGHREEPVEVETVEEEKTEDKEY